MSVAQKSALSSPVDAIDEASPRYLGWRVVAACFAMAVYAWGFGFYSHSFYLAELQRTYGWSASIITGATTTFYLISAVLGAFAGDVIARFGARTVTITGIVLTGVSAALVPFVDAPWQLYAAFVLTAFGWAATSLTAISTILGTWFSAKRGLAISIGLTGASFGGILVVPLLTLGSARWGFGPSVWAVAGGLGSLAAALALAFFARDPPFGRLAIAKNANAQVPMQRTAILRSTAFWSVSAPFSLVFFAQVGFLVHQIAMLEPNTGRALAGVAVAVTTGAAVVGRLVLGAVVDRVDQRFATALSVLSQAAALFVVWLARDPFVLLAACAVFGFSVGNVITLPALIIAREFPARDFATVVGLSNAVCQTTFAFGPGLLGALRDGTGGYGVPLIVCVAVDTLAAFLIVWTAPARRTRMDASG